MDRSKYEFLNSLLDKEIEIAKNRSLSFTDSRNSFLTNVQKSHQSGVSQNQQQSQQIIDQQHKYNQQNDTYDHSTTNNSYNLNINASNNKSFNDISYDDSRNYYEKKRASDFSIQQPGQQNTNIIQRGRDQNMNLPIHQNNLFERNNKQEAKSQQIVSNQELGSSYNNSNSNTQNNQSQSNKGLQGNDSSFKLNSNGNFHLKNTPENNKQQYYGIDSSAKNNFENSIAQYNQKNSRNALQTSINQSSGFSPFDNSKYMRNDQHSPDNVNNSQKTNEDSKIAQVSNPLAIQAQNQIEDMRRHISQNSMSPYQRNSVSPGNNTSSQSVSQNQQNQQKLQQLYQNYSRQYRQQQDSYQGKSQQESYSLQHHYDSNLSSSEERKNQFQKEFESIQHKIQALENKLKITEEKNEQLAGISQENEQNSIISQKNQIHILDEQANSTFQNKRISDMSIFTNPTIKYNQVTSTHSNNQISPRFNIQESIFFQQQDSHSKNNSTNKNENKKQNSKQNSSSGKKKVSSSSKKNKIKSSSRKSEPSDTDSGMKPKNFETNESIENTGKYIKKLEVQILNDSRDLKDDNTSKSRQIRFKTPTSKKNSSLPPSSSHANSFIIPSSTNNLTNKQQPQQPPVNKDEKNMYSEEIKALQKEYQMWEYRQEKQHLQLLHMQDNNKRNSSKLSKLKKQSNKFVKIKKEQELHLTEYDQLYYNFEKCELIRQKQKILISCLKDELKLLQKKANSKLIN